MKRILFLVLGVALTFSLNAQIFSDDFQDQDMSDWTTVTPTYAQDAPYNWHLSSHAGDYYLSGSCYDGSANHVTEQWVISPAFATTGKTNVSITFENRLRYATNTNLKLFVSTTASGDSASFSASDWTEITGLTLDATTDDYDWATTTNALGVDGEASVRIAFKFTSTVDNGGNWVVDTIQIAEGTAAIKSVNNTVSVFPNPTVNVLNISAVANVTIMNIAGQEVMKATETTSVDVSALQAGVYFANVQTAEGVSVQKFVKK